MSHICIAGQGKEGKEGKGDRQTEIENQRKGELRIFRVEKE